MISSSLRPVHPTGTASGHRVPTLPISPRFGKTAIRPHYRNPLLKYANKTVAARNEDKRIAEVMRRLYVTLKNSLAPAIKGNPRQREKDIADALARIRRDHPEIDKPKPHGRVPYKPFRARA